MKDPLNKIKLAKIDCHINKAYCNSEWNVRSYPTFLILYEGNVIKYEGERMASSFIKSLRSWVIILLLKF